MGYVPMVAPLIFVLLAHGITVITLILIKSGVLPQGMGVHKTLVTWGVYGVLPLLLCSYGCFFAVARPVTGLIERRRPDWPATTVTLVAGAAYGGAIVLILLALLTPGSVLRIFFLLLIGMATGMGNWLLFRALTVVPEQVAPPDRADL